jgi:hypothetical protein
VSEHTTHESESPAQAATRVFTETGDVEAAADAFDAAYESRRAAREQAAEFTTTASQPTQGRTARGTTVTLPAATEIATSLMMQDGLSREAALEKLVSNRQATLSDLGNRIEQARTQLVGEASAREDADYAASPEGRRIAAQAAADALAQRERDVKNARALAIEENPQEDPALFLRMPDSEILRFVGLEADPAAAAEAERQRKANDPEHQKLAAASALLDEWWQLAPGEREARAAEIGVSFDALNERAWEIEKRAGRA